jgi:hypothetical protein
MHQQPHSSFATAEQFGDFGHAILRPIPQIDRLPRTGAESLHAERQILQRITGSFVPVVNELVQF